MLQTDDSRKQAGAARRQRWRQPGLPLAALHLAALTSLAIARPYFQPLANGADFLITLGVTSGDVIAFALAIVVVPPLVLVLAEWLVGLVSIPARRLLHLAFVGGLIALMIWQAFNHGGSAPAGSVVVPVSLLVGGLAAVAYWRLAPVRSWVTVLTPAPLVVLAMFLVFSPIRALAFGGEGHRPPAVSASSTPVVWVMLDELPVGSLMDSDENIDAARYPAFADLARDSTWYRNTATVSDYTQNAVPTELTGRTVRGDELQVAAEHPDSLFTLMGRGYHLDVTEFATHLCGEAACPVQLRHDRQRRVRAMFSGIFSSIRVFPSWVRGRLARAVAPKGPGSAAYLMVSSDRSVERHAENGKIGRFQVFLNALRPSRGRTLNYLHVDLPHRPFNLLPTGQAYGGTRRYTESVYGALPRDPVAATIDQQRHLAQLALTDLMLGRTLERLRRIGLYDRALLVVTADHGAAFKPGAEQRAVREANAEEIAFVPFFVKAPGQRRGRIVDTPLQTNDVLPTVAAALGIHIPWKTDGHPAGSGGRPRSLTIYSAKGGTRVTVSRPRLERGRRAALRRKLARFGSGRRSIYGLGPQRWLLGRRVAGLHAVRAGGVTATVDAPARFESVDPHALLLPADIDGAVHGGRPHSRAIAVAVNDRVAATGRTLVRGGQEFFIALVPPTAFRRGKNDIQVFEVSGTGRRAVLQRLTR